MSNCALLPAYALFSPFAMGIPVHKDQQPCRNGVSPAAAAGLADHGHQSQGVSWLVCSRKRGWMAMGATALPTVTLSPLSAHSLSFLAAAIPIDGSCGTA